MLQETIQDLINNLKPRIYYVDDVDLGMSHAGWILTESKGTEKYPCDEVLSIKTFKGIVKVYISY